MVLLLVFFMVGFGVGAVSFSGLQTTVTKSLIVTSLLTSLQRVTETRTQFTTITQTVMNTSVVTSATGWREIKRFTGSAEMTTEPFNVPVTTWRIRWSYNSSQPAVFSFFVYQVGQIGYIESVSSYTAGGSSVTYIYKGSSDFYLKITTGVPYTIIVEVPS